MTGKTKIIVLGNEKGGSGKSTTAMHIVTALMTAGNRVGSLDLDPRQRTLTRYLENRSRFCETHKADLAMPEHLVIQRSDTDSRQDADAEEAEVFGMALERVSRDADYVVIDCPGTDTNLSRLAHSVAHVLVTPLNDSFVDLDLLAKVDPDTLEIKGPSFYAELVWDARKRRAIESRDHIDWLVMRNRVGYLHAHNMARVEQVLEKLAKRIGFRFANGLSERVIYRELFLKGLTLLDLRDEAVQASGSRMSMSHVAARQELATLMTELLGEAGQQAIAV